MLTITRWCTVSQHTATSAQHMAHLVANRNTTFHLRVTNCRRGCLSVQVGDEGRRRGTVWVWVCVCGGVAVGDLEWALGLYHSSGHLLIHPNQCLITFPQPCRTPHGTSGKRPRGHLSNFTLSHLLLCSLSFCLLIVHMDLFHSLFAEGVFWSGLVL